MIHIVAVLTAKSGERPAMMTAFNAIVDAVRAEPGCIEYRPVTDLAHSPAKFGTDALVVIEKWQDQAALDTHNQAEAVNSFRAAAGHLIAQADIYLMQDVY